MEIWTKAFPLLCFKLTVSIRRSIPGNSKSSIIHNDTRLYVKVLTKRGIFCAEQHFSAEQHDFGTRAFFFSKIQLKLLLNSHFSPYCAFWNLYCISGRIINVHTVRNLLLVEAYSINKNDTLKYQGCHILIPPQPAVRGIITTKSF